MSCQLQVFTVTEEPDTKRRSLERDKKKKETEKKRREREMKIQREL
jgi:hypothetical protein